MRSVLLLVLCGNTFAAYYGDPSKQEIELFEWSSGVRIAFCIDAPVADVSSAFKKAFAKTVNKYCETNRTACNLRNTVSFNPEHIVFLDGFPRREYSTLNMKFFVLMPHSSRPLQKVYRPLLSRAALSDMLNQHQHEIENRLGGWDILSHERHPRYDAITEFMNIAIIPIVVFSLPLMVFLAYWTSNLRPNMSSESFLVMGASGGKNYAYRRTLEIIAEQNLEIERERKMALTRHILITPPREVVGQSAGLLLDVAKLSIGTAHLPSEHLRRKGAKVPKGPQITVDPGSAASSAQGQENEAEGSEPYQRLEDLPEHEALQIDEEEDTELAPLPHPHPSHLHPYAIARANRFRRLSSVEEMSKRRGSRSRLMSASGASTGSGGRRWKAGSLILFGARK